MGVPGRDILLSPNDGISAYPTLLSLTESPLEEGLYYAGADDGRVHVSRDGGGHWTDLTGRFPGLPSHAPAVALVASAFAEGTAYAAFDNHEADDYEPYLYVTPDFGGSWSSLASTLPPGQVVNCITEDPRNPDVLYLGTESGLFLSLDRGRHWRRVENNLPTVPIDEIGVHPRDNDLLLATHGRSIWILDDVSPIQEAAEAMGARAYLFSIDPAAQIRMKNDFAGYPGDRRFWGENPLPGASITWYAGEAPSSVQLIIRDTSGAVVRELGTDDLNDPLGPGLNRASWDLRGEPTEAPQGRTRPGGGRGGRRAPGPLVAPGEYRVTLVLDGEVVGSRPVQVWADPLLPPGTEGGRELPDTLLGLNRRRSDPAESPSGG